MNKTRAALLVVILTAPVAAVSAQSPPDAELRFSTGIMHLREGRVDMALDEFRKAVKQDPKNPFFQKGLGQALAAKGDWGGAIAAFRKALELNPMYVDVKNDLGYALIMSGQREAGKREFLAAFGDPMNPAPEISAFNLGRAFYEEKNYREAANWFRTSVGRNKAYGAAYVMLAEALASSGSLEEATAQLEVGMRDAPGDAEVLLAMGRFYAKAGRFAEARIRLDEALKADPSGAAGRAAAEQLKALPK
jgi:Tfp pilus assembly protein PilF